MTAVWPDTLPTKMLRDGFGGGMGDGRLRTQTDTGPGKTRNRFSAVVQPVSGTMRMTEDQRAILEAFVRDDLDGGTLGFEFPAQWGSGTWIVQIADDMPAWQPVGVGAWDVALNLVILP